MVSFTNCTGFDGQQRTTHECAMDLAMFSLMTDDGEAGLGNGLRKDMHIPCETGDRRRHHEGPVATCLLQVSIKTESQGHQYIVARSSN
jgi:hypothetical protein